MAVIHLMLMLPRVRSSLMAQKHEFTNDLKSGSLSDSTQASILVLLSARAIGSLGFAMSLLAIWFGWLLPVSLTAPAPSEVKPRPVPKHHRRSVSSPPVSTQLRRNSTPVDLAPILVPYSEENLHDSSRRVYFADSLLSSPVRQNTMPEPKNSSATPVSHHPSSSPPETPPDTSLDDLSAQDSDSSLSRPSRLNKLKLGFNPKSNRQSSVDKQFDTVSVTSIAPTTSEKATKRGCVTACLISRVRAAADNTEQGSASPSSLPSVRLSSPSTPATATTFAPSLPRPTNIRSHHKAERRSSAPIPRTYPYGAPYFASPPILLDKNTYPSYLKTLPQFEDEIQFSSARASKGGREPTIQMVSSNPSRRTVPKHRSVSEDWTVRPSTTFNS